MLLSIVAVLVCIPTSSVKEFLFLLILSSIYAQHHSLSEKCKLKPQWGTISHRSEWMLSNSPVHFKGLCVLMEACVCVVEPAEACWVPYTVPYTAIQRIWTHGAEAVGNKGTSTSHPEVWPEAQGTTDFRDNISCGPRYSSASLDPKHTPHQGARRKLGN